MNTSRGVLVTGGASSVGRVVAEKYLAQGARVHVCDVSEAAVADVLAANAGLSATVASVGNEADVARVVDDAISAVGQVDVLVNCVGIAGPRGLIEELDTAAWNQTMEVNLNGMFYTMRALIPGMKARKQGAIVNFSSASTRSRLPSRTAYVVSKFAVEGLTLNAARELGPFNVRCNAILPGAIDNQRLRDVLGRIADERGTTVEEVESQALRFNSMRTKIAPAELADAVLFLCSEQAPHITGQLFEVSGGHEWEE